MNSKLKQRKSMFVHQLSKFLKFSTFGLNWALKKYWCLLINILRTNCPIGTGFFSQTGINVLSQVAKMGGCRGEERVNTRWIEKVLILCFTILLLYLIFISNSQNVLCLWRELERQAIWREAIKTIMIVPLSSLTPLTNWACMHVSYCPYHLM